MCTYLGGLVSLIKKGFHVQIAAYNENDVNLTYCYKVICLIFWFVLLFKLFVQIASMHMFSCSTMN
jgi:hypothetical protein